VPRLSHLRPGIETRYPLCRRLDGPQGQSGGVWKISPPPGFSLRTGQPIASHYTEYATPSTSCIVCSNKNNFQAFGLCESCWLSAEEKGWGGDAHCSHAHSNEVLSTPRGGELFTPWQLVVRNNRNSRQQKFRPHCRNQFLSVRSNVIHHHQGPLEWFMCLSCGHTAVSTCDGNV
jgi:hypothetical protein